MAWKHVHEVNALVQILNTCQLLLQAVPVTVGKDSEVAAAVWLLRPSKGVTCWMKTTGLVSTRIAPLVNKLITVRTNSICFKTGKLGASKHDTT